MNRLTSTSRLSGWLRVVRTFAIVGIYFEVHFDYLL